MNSVITLMLLNKERTLAAIESTNILQEEEDENISMKEYVKRRKNKAI
jgi:hypothetical protein